MFLTESGEPPLVFRMAFIVFLMVLSVLGSLFSIAMVGYLGIEGEKDFIGAVWRGMFFEFLVLVFPVAIAIEVMWVRWKERKFHMLSVAISTALFLETAVVLVSIGFAFEILFPGLSFATAAPFPGFAGLIFGLLIAIPLLVLTLTYRIPKVRNYVKKAFE